MKKFVNDPKQFVPEMLNGVALANPDTLRYVPEYNLIMRTDAPKADKVSIVQGSGSGWDRRSVTTSWRKRARTSSPQLRQALRQPATARCIVPRACS